MPLLQIVRYVVPTAAPRVSLPPPLSSPSVPHHLSRRPKSRGRNFKSSPCTHRTGCTHPQNGGPNRETNEARGGGVLHWSGKIGRYFVHSAEATAAPTHALLTHGARIIFRGAEF
jgi:hypothetical protein